MSSIDKMENHKRPRDMDEQSDAKKAKASYSKATVVTLLKSKDAVLECPEKRSSTWKRFGRPKIVDIGEILINFAVCL